MRNLQTLVLMVGAMVCAAPAYANSTILAGGPTHAQNYTVQNGVKVYRLSSSSQHSVEHGVQVHRLMSAPVYAADPNGYNPRSTYENKIIKIKKKAEKQRKKAFKKGYTEGYRDGYQTALENNPYRRPIRLRQRIRTRPQVSAGVLSRRNLQ